MEGFVDPTPLMGCGVYLLMYRATVVYVGKSTKPFARLATHLNLMAKARRGAQPRGAVKTVLFDKVVFKGCMLGELDELERSLIKEFKPRYNEVHRPKMVEEVRLNVGGREVVLNQGGPPMVQAMRRI